MSLKVNNLSGGYFGQNILKHVSFQIKSGEIVGLLGLNGAGKSTLFKALTNQLPQFEGQIEWDNLSMEENNDQFLKQVSYLPERPMLYPELTLWEHIELLQRLNDLPQEMFEKAEVLLHKFRLEKMKARKPYYFSKGMQQKAMIVQVLLLDTPLILLDEPFSGLDPLSVYTLREMLLEAKEEGKIILLTTHLLHEAEQICDRYLWLQDGEILSEQLEGSSQLTKDTDLTLEDIYLKRLDKGEKAHD